MFNVQAVKGTVTGGEVDRGDDNWEHRRWTARIRFEGRTFQTVYRTGMGIEGTPSIADVLDAVFTDARCYLDAEDAEEFALNFGYEPDSHTARKLYNECERVSARLMRLFGRDYDAAEKVFYDNA